MSKVNIKFNKNAKKIMDQIALDAIGKNGLNIRCPKCGKDIHLSFSGDTCKFCGTIINYGTEPNV